MIDVVTLVSKEKNVFFVIKLSIYKSSLQDYYYSYYNRYYYDQNDYQYNVFSAWFFL